MIICQTKIMDNKIKIVEDDSCSYSIFINNKVMESSYDLEFLLKKFKKLSDKLMLDELVVRVFNNGFSVNDFISSKGYENFISVTSKEKSVVVVYDEGKFIVYEKVAGCDVKTVPIEELGKHVFAESKNPELDAAYLNVHRFIHNIYDYFNYVSSKDKH